MWTAFGAIIIGLIVIIINILSIFTDDFANDYDGFSAVVGILTLIAGVFGFIGGIIANSPILLLGIIFLIIGGLSLKSVDDCQGIGYSFISDMKRKESMRGK